ncbi:MAG TPA: hypothetical protein VEA16_12135 [Vicinamibacterales bacterium]|nr:hypothetical protein [Vicinamibacterales bacterium]
MDRRTVLRMMFAGAGLPVPARPRAAAGTQSGAVVDITFGKWRGRERRLFEQVPYAQPGT